MRTIVPIAIHNKSIPKHTTVPIANHLRITTTTDMRANKIPSINKWILKDLTFAARKVVKIKIRNIEPIIYIKQPVLLCILYKLDQLLTETKVLDL